MGQVKIEIVVDPQGNVGCNFPQGVPPVVLMGALEVAKQTVIMQFYKPVSEGSIVPATPDMMPKG